TPTLFCSPPRRPPLSTLFPYTTLFRSQSQGIKIGSLVAPHPIGLNQSQHADLLLVAFAAYLTAADRQGPTGILCERQKVLADSGVGNVRPGPAGLGQLVEVAAPLFGDTVRIVQIELVQLFNVGGIPT